MMEKIRIGQPVHSNCELDSLKEVLDSGCWAGTCEKVQEFEKLFAEKVHAKHAIAVSSATTGLHAAMAAEGITRRMEVIVADYTFPASAFAVMHCGATPILADVDRDTYCIDPQDILRKINTRTHAIMPVNQFGMPCDIGEIVDIAEDNDLKVIWDTATGLGSQYDGVQAGSTPNCEVFSTYPTKVLSTGEGGIITTNNDEIAEYLKSMIDFGKVKNGTEITFDKLGYNYRLSALLAAIGICQLNRLQHVVDVRRMLAERYLEMFNEAGEHLEWITPQTEPVDRKSAYQRFVCTLKDEKDQNALIAHMAKQQIQCVKGNYALHLEPIFQPIFNDIAAAKCPESEWVFKHSIALPLHPDMSAEDVTRVVDTLRTFKGK